MGKEKEIGEGLIDKYGLDKFKAVMKQQNKFIKIYNNLCRACKHKVSIKPEMEKEKYCLRCQNVISNHN